MPSACCSTNLRASAKPEVRQGHEGTLLPQLSARKSRISSCIIASLVGGAARPAANDGHAELNEPDGLRSGRSCRGVVAGPQRTHDTVRGARRSNERLNERHVVALRAEGVEEVRHPSLEERGRRQVTRVQRHLSGLWVPEEVKSRQGSEEAGRLSAGGCGGARGSSRGGSMGEGTAPGEVRCEEKWEGESRRPGGESARGTRRLSAAARARARRRRPRRRASRGTCCTVRAAGQRGREDRVWDSDSCGMQLSSAHGRRADTPHLNVLRPPAGRGGVCDSGSLRGGFIQEEDLHLRRTRGEREVFVTSSGTRQGVCVSTVVFICRYMRTPSPPSSSRRHVALRVIVSEVLCVGRRRHRSVPGRP